MTERSKSIWDREVKTDGIKKNESTKEDREKGEMVKGQKKKRRKDNMELKLKFENPKSDAILRNKRG